MVIPQELVAQVVVEMAHWAQHQQAAMAQITLVAVVVAVELMVHIKMAITAAQGLLFFLT